MTFDRDEEDDGKEVFWEETSKPTRHFDARYAKIIRIVMRLYGARYFRTLALLILFALLVLLIAVTGGLYIHILR